MQNTMTQRKMIQPPTKGIWRHFSLLLPLTLVLTLLLGLYIRSVMGSYQIVGRRIEGVTFSAADVSLSDEGVVEVVSVEPTNDGRTLVKLRAVGDGTTTLSLGAERVGGVWYLKVSKGAIIEGGINFSGWQSIYVSLCILLLVAIVLFGIALARLWRSSWYGYTMVACGGGLLFCLFHLVGMVGLYVAGSLDSFAEFAYHVAYAPDWFVMVSLAPMAVLALLVSVSNFSLILHEGMRPVNLLGIAVSVVWIVACVIWYRAGGLVYELSGSFDAALIVGNLMSTAVAFGEFLLLSTMLCAWAASRHKPRQQPDYLIVLGCGLRDDGTPCPLLAGRVDKARALDQGFVASGAKPATFVPSGGQGPDEIMSEAQSMGNYLVGKGVSKERIVLEDRSTTTRENMAFSREVIERHAGRDASNLRVAFSTTNYHVFRGYVCAHQAGMAVEGMGAKTRAYFWPNAFLREFAGLLATQWKAILQLYLIIAAVYCLAAYAMQLGRLG